MPDAAPCHPLAGCTVIDLRGFSVAGPQRPVVELRGRWLENAL